MKAEQRAFELQKLRDGDTVPVTEAMHQAFSGADVHVVGNLQWVLLLGIVVTKTRHPIPRTVRRMRGAFYDVAHLTRCSNVGATENLVAFVTHDRGEVTLLEGLWLIDAARQRGVFDVENLQDLRGPDGRFSTRRPGWDGVKQSLSEMHAAGRVLKSAARAGLFT